MPSIITKYNPWSVFKDLHGDLNQLLQNRDKLLAELNGQESELLSPRVDIKEEPEQFVIIADLPGINPKDLEISLENNILSIKGVRTIERNLKEENYSKIERFSGSFYRQFTLPDHVDSDAIKASGKHGVLEIVIPKKERLLPKKISVHSNE